MIRVDWRMVGPIIALLSALAAGCGPGVGGTGTGGDAPTPAGDILAAFGASPAPLCSAEFADRLDCPAPAAGLPSALGTAPVHYVDDPQAAAAEASFDGNGIDFAAPCEGLRFSGSWGSVPGRSGGQFFGRVGTDQASATTPATLDVRSSPGGLSMLLQDAQGNVLFGPRVLVRADVPAIPATCP